MPVAVTLLHLVDLLVPFTFGRRYTFAFGVVNVGWLRDAVDVTPPDLPRLFTFDLIPVDFDTFCSRLDSTGLLDHAFLVYVDSGSGWITFVVQLITRITIYTLVLISLPFAVAAVAAAPAARFTPCLRARALFNFRIGRVAVADARVTVTTRL